MFNLRQAGTELLLGTLKLRIGIFGSGGWAVVVSAVLEVVVVVVEVLVVILVVVGVVAVVLFVVEVIELF